MQFELKRLLKQIKSSESTLKGTISKTSELKMNESQISFASNTQSESCQAIGFNDAPTEFCSSSDVSYYFSEKKIPAENQLLSNELIQSISNQKQTSQQNKSNHNRSTSSFTEKAHEKQIKRDSSLVVQQIIDLNQQSSQIQQIINKDIKSEQKKEITLNSASQTQRISPGTRDNKIHKNNSINRIDKQASNQPKTSNNKDKNIKKQKRLLKQQSLSNDPGIALGQNGNQQINPDQKQLNQKRRSSNKKSDSGGVSGANSDFSSGEKQPNTAILQQQLNKPSQEAIFSKYSLKERQLLEPNQNNEIIKLVLDEQKNSSNKTPELNLVLKKKQNSTPEQNKCPLQNENKEIHETIKNLEDIISGDIQKGQIDLGNEKQIEKKGEHKQQHAEFNNKKQIHEQKEKSSTKISDFKQPRVDSTKFEHNINNVSSERQTQNQQNETKSFTPFQINISGLINKQRQEMQDSVQILQNPLDAKADEEKNNQDINNQQLQKDQSNSIINSLQKESNRNQIKKSSSQETQLNGNSIGQSVLKSSKSEEGTIVQKVLKKQQIDSNIKEPIKNNRSSFEKQTPSSQNDQVKIKEIKQLKRDSIEQQFELLPIVSKQCDSLTNESHSQNQLDNSKCNPKITTQFERKSSLNSGSPLLSRRMSKGSSDLKINGDKDLTLSQLKVNEICTTNNSKNNEYSTPIKAESRTNSVLSGETNKIFFDYIMPIGSSNNQSLIQKEVDSKINFDKGAFFESAQNRRLFDQTGQDEVTQAIERTQKLLFSSPPQVVNSMICTSQIQVSKDVASSYGLKLSKELSQQNQSLLTDWAALEQKLQNSSKKINEGFTFSSSLLSPIQYTPGASYPTFAFQPESQTELILISSQGLQVDKPRLSDIASFQPNYQLETPIQMESQNNLDQIVPRTNLPFVPIQPIFGSINQILSRDELSYETMNPGQMIPDDHSLRTDEKSNLVIPTSTLYIMFKDQAKSGKNQFSDYSQSSIPLMSETHAEAAMPYSNTNYILPSEFPTYKIPQNQELKNEFQNSCSFGPIQEQYQQNIVDQSQLYQSKSTPVDTNVNNQIMTKISKLEFGVNFPNFGILKQMVDQQSVPDDEEPQQKPFVPILVKDMILMKRVIRQFTLEQVLNKLFDNFSLSFSKLTKQFFMIRMKKLMDQYGGYSTSMNNQIQRELSSFFDVADSNQEWRLNINKLGMALTGLCNEELDQESEQLRKQFKEIDQSNLGNISAFDLIKYYQSRNQQYSQNEIINLFKQIDTEKKGFVTYFDFLMHSKNPMISNLR